ncbi:hypothetical protein QK325_31440, partial [Pseudomonas aeruginosa]|nr:hypothetical protein [Pseudomonas aeruginosa]
VRDWVKNRRGQPEKLKNTGQTYIMIEKCETLDMLEWAIERARAALAQPSPASDLDPLNLAPHAEAFNEAPAEALKPEPAEADRPEVVAWQYRVTAGPQTGWSLWHPGKGEEFERSYTVERRPLMTVAQHERIVKAWIERWKAYIELSAKIAAQRDAANARLHEVATACATAEQERDAALARVAELERQEPVAWMHDQPNRVDVIHRDVKDLLQRVPGSSRGIHRPLDVSEHYTIPLYAAPVAQAQQLHNLDKQCRDDVARALGLRPNQERGFAWSYLLASIKSCVKASGDSAQAQHSVP